jgi:hypothetical protein
MFFYPLAGVAYQFLHYLVGLRRLGYDVYYIEDSARPVYDPTSNTMTEDASGNVERVAPILQAYGFGERWAFRGFYPGGKCYGMTGNQIDRMYRDADAILNVTGAQEMREEHMACPRRVYVESDPFAYQVKAAQQDPKTVAHLDSHDTHFTFGENIGQPDCLTPAGRYRWMPTRQPVVMDLWREADEAFTTPGRDAYTTITTWHNNVKAVTWEGETYHWTKDREFEGFLDLPRRRSVPLQLATRVDPPTNRRLRDLGWSLADSVVISDQVDLYRAYIQQSRAEFTVARDQYVRPRTGWFSDRSVCYLAAGRPVITQETGFSKYVPSGKGLFGFTTMNDVLAAVDEIESDYEGNRRAAREIAAEYFAADKVLVSLMERL